LSRGRVIFYDYAHCSEFLEGIARDLHESAAAGSAGLDAFGLYRPLFTGFANEALETNAITLGQFDTGLVYIFIPQEMRRELCPDANKTARNKAIELLKCQKAPMIFDIRSAQSMEPAVASHAHYKEWMPPELLELVQSEALDIQIVINGHAFFEQIVCPILTKNGFSTTDEYLSSARLGYVRAQSPEASASVFKLPWVKWLREMLTGGFSMSYPMACLATYIEKMNEAVKPKSKPGAPAPGAARRPAKK